MYLTAFTSFSQEVTLYEQLNGRYDFTFVGNTMNIAENNPSNFLVTFPSSSANLTLLPNQSLLKAYLYWAGSGDGDFEVKLNGNDILPDRTFSHVVNHTFPEVLTLTYFSAFKDITEYVQSFGNGTYTLSDLDISPFVLAHYSRKTNFAGWAILLIYEDPDLPLNQINIYDGLQGVPNALTINLDNLNILDNSGAKAGFIAWEGDKQLATETFLINNQVLSNALNPANNVFNGTNSVTGSTTLHNMDLDIYDIEDYIAVGNTNAVIELTSSQDFIMINTVVTKLNSQLPDATIQITDYETTCESNEVTVYFTVSNNNSTDVLPVNTPIGFFIGDQLIGTTATQSELPINASENGTIVLSIPNGIPEIFQLTAIVDYNNQITELIETNNSFTFEITQLFIPNFNDLEDIINCNLGNTTGLFDFSTYETEVLVNPDDVVSFHPTFEDAITNENAIFNTSNYQITTTTEEIFVRITAANGCFVTTSFLLKIRNCAPIIYNGVSANNDGLNDTFFIDGLRDIFVNFELLIYNRWGKHIWTGNHNTSDWDGFVKEGIGSKNAPEGTYFYILKLNDPEYPNPYTGYLYLTR